MLQITFRRGRDSSDGVQMLPLAAKDIKLTGLSWQGSTWWLCLLWEELKGFGEASLRAGSVNCHRLGFSCICWHLRPLLCTGSVLMPGHCVSYSHLLGLCVKLEMPA